MIMSLREWYADREVLLTGVTSELGRGLLEKLLRCFPDITVHAVLRSRYSLNKDERVKKIFSSQRYERLRQENPGAIERVKALEGNLLYDGLGLTKDDVHSLRKVSLVIHAAGPYDAVLEFCQQLPELRAVATATNIFRYKGQITETLQNEHVPDVPLALVRFPVVGPAYREPMPGFVEILKGPTAFMVGAGIAFGYSNLPAQVIPVDMAVNTLLATAWDRGTREKSEGPLVYNAATVGCKWGDLIKKGHRASRKFAYPTFGIRGMTSNVAVHWICIMLLEWLPSLFCDTVVGLFGFKHRILGEHDRVRNALRSLESISSRPWPVERNGVYLLQQRLTSEDQDAFPVTADIDIESYLVCAAAAARKYCVDETNLKIVKTVRIMCFTLVLGVLIYFVMLTRWGYAEEKNASFNRPDAILDPVSFE